MHDSYRILVTGGAGFIGSALIRYLIKSTNNKVLNIDKLTYAGNLKSLETIEDDERYQFQKIDICNFKVLKKTFDEFRPNIIMHLAAESHVDRSINNPDNFITTNIFGTYNLLKISLDYWKNYIKKDNRYFLFHHISTDEVYGDLDNDHDLFSESNPYDPSSPYSASKASSDHLVRAWHRTYQLPTVITNCSNNYGPYHHPEKFIPMIITNALLNKDITIYGKGEQIRDWLYVDDHVKALYKVVTEGSPGETYNIGSNNERKNIDVAKKICEILDIIKPANNFSYQDLIRHVKDRPGHDRRYAIDSSKIQSELSWTPEESFESGLKKSVNWFLDNEDWLSAIQK